MQSGKFEMACLASVRFNSASQGRTMRIPRISPTEQQSCVIEVMNLDQSSASKQLGMFSVYWSVGLRIRLIDIRVIAPARLVSVVEAS